MEINNASLCNGCMAEYAPLDAFCNTCGFPIQGTEREQELHHSERSVKEIELIDLEEKVENARKSLFWVAGLCGISFLFTAFKGSSGADQTADMIVTLILIAAFLGLGLLAKRKASTALISGLSLYVILNLLIAIVDPISIFSGIIVKIIIIGYLIKGIKAVIEADNLKKELNIL